MTTTFIDAAGEPPVPPPVPAVDRAPRPLGLWRALGWTVLAILAALAVVVLDGLALGIWGLMHPGRPIPVPNGQGLPSAILLGATLAAFFALLVLACAC